MFDLPVAFAQSAAKDADAAGGVANETANQLANLINYVISMLPLWIVGFIVIIFSVVVARVVKGMVENKMSKEGFEEDHKEVQIVAARTAHAAVLIVGTTVGLKIAGLDLTPIIAAGAFGIGFALQDLIMNFLAGVMILGARHYTIGDVISVNGTTGRIEAIQNRATIVKAFDGTKVIIPNAELFKNKVISKTSNPTRRLEFIMGCGYDDDLRAVKKVTLDTLKTIPGILAKPGPKVVFYEWGDFEILFKIKVWIDTHGGKMLKVKNEVMMKLTDAYNNANFEMPYPINTTELTTMYSPRAQLDVNLTKLKPGRSLVSVDNSIEEEAEGLQENSAPLPAQPIQVNQSMQSPQPQATPEVPVSINKDPGNWLQNALKEQLQSQPAQPIQSEPAPQSIPSFDQNYASVQSPAEPQFQPQTQPVPMDMQYNQPQMQPSTQPPIQPSPTQNFQNPPQQ